MFEVLVNNAFLMCYYDASVMQYFVIVCDR